MRYGVFLTFAGLLQTAFSLPNYPIPTSNGYAPAPIHTSDGYAPAPKPRCTYVDEIEYEEKCEEYKDRVCYTSYDEHCEDVYDQTCRSFVSKGQTRKCFNVTETVCTLKEDISYEVIDAVFTVQKCSRGSEKVCDTIYDMEETKKQRKECIKVPSLVCTTEEKTVHEKTCRTLTKFDCDTALLTSGGYEPAYSYDSRGQQSNEPEHQEPSSYDTTEHTTHSHTSGETKCKKREETRCNTTPRQITSQYCKKSEEKVCEQLTERQPVPYQTAHCRNEGKKSCRVEQKTQPKQIKKYHYKKVCSPLVKKICDIWDDHKLVPTCVPTVRHICHHNPKEHCEDVPKNHCYKIPRTVRKEKCDNTEEVLHPTDPHTASYQ